MIVLLIHEERAVFLERAAREPRPTKRAQECQDSR
jgi:hypothetical protein